MTDWDDAALRSPVSGLALRADTPHSLRADTPHSLRADARHSLRAGDERWPVVENIPFLRADRRALADAALAALDDGRADDALTVLLADQDNWARTPPPSEADRRRLVRDVNTLSFRAAMELLAFGPVGAYFAHRWSDPTFLSGLALAEAHAAPGSVFELACGAGHFLREFARCDREAAGADIVFAKLWLARRYLAPGARLICFDAAEPWPLADGSFDTVFCHDAFYFLPQKQHVASEMLRVSAGPVLVGHAHNALVETLSSGSPLTPGAYAALFGAPLVYDDQDLTAALIGAHAPRPAGIEALAAAPAVSMAARCGAPRRVSGGLAVPRAGAALRRNPLYDGDIIRWPSERYAMEYGPLATYPARADGPLTAIAGADPAIDALARRRVLLDLPASW